MLVTRINPDWAWPRAKNVAINKSTTTDRQSELGMSSMGREISYTDGVKETTPHERPALHRSLMRSFDQYLVDGDHAHMIVDWYEAHGPLTIDGTVDSFLEEASIAWWVTNVIDRFGGIGAYSTEDAIHPDKVRLFAADSLYLDVPNPTLKKTFMGKFSRSRGEIVAKLVENFGSEGWRLPYSALLDQTIRHINLYLDRNVTLINESPWDMGRDRFGKKDPSRTDDTTTHRITTVAQPRNLSGYIWLRIQHQLEETPNINYYPCGNFEDCGQELPIMSDVSRRKWCSNACRMSKK